MIIDRTIWKNFRSFFIINWKKKFKPSIFSITGDISFEGDLIIHGNIAAGMALKATGSITVSGHVESAKIEAVSAIRFNATLI